MPRVIAAHSTPPGTFAKKDATSSSTAITGTIICPLTPCTMIPSAPAYVVVWFRTAAASSTPPSAIHFLNPKKANAISAVWMTTSSATK